MFFKICHSRVSFESPRSVELFALLLDEEDAVVDAEAVVAVVVESSSSSWIVLPKSDGTFQSKLLFFKKFINWENKLKLKFFLGNFYLKLFLGLGSSSRGVSLSRRGLFKYSNEIGFFLGSWMAFDFDLTWFDDNGWTVVEAVIVVLELFFDVSIFLADTIASSRCKK